MIFCTSLVTLDSTLPRSINSLANHKITTALTSPVTSESSADHMTDLGSTLEATTESSVDHEIGLRLTSTTTTKLPLAEGHSTAQHQSIVATVGSSVNLSCATDNEHTPFWDYYPLGRSHVTIYNGGQHR